MDELSLLGVKTASYEERLRGLRSDMDRLSGRVDALERGAGLDRDGHGDHHHHRK